MSFQQAVDLTSDLDSFTRYVEKHSLNGIIGDIRNYHHVDADVLFERMMEVARGDVDALLKGTASQSAGKELW